MRKIPAAGLLKRDIGPVIRWVLVGLVLALMMRQASDGCSTMVEEGTPAPAFALPDAGTGPTWTLESFRGAPIALVFFATWCPSCREELPHIARVLREAPGTKVLLLSDEDPDHVGAWLKAKGFAIPAAGRAGRTWKAYGVNAVPSVVVVGADGTVAYSEQGGGSLVRALSLARPPAPSP